VAHRRDDSEALARCAVRRHDHDLGRSLQSKQRTCACLDEHRSRDSGVLLARLGHRARNSHRRASQGRLLGTRAASHDLRGRRGGCHCCRRQSSSLPISRRGSHDSGSPFIPTRRGSSSSAGPRLRTDGLEASASRSRSTSSGSRITAHLDGPATASCSGGSR
jgi:hypothetical protein